MKSSNYNNIQKNTEFFQFLGFFIAISILPLTPTAHRINMIYCAIIRKVNIKIAKSKINRATAHFNMLNYSKFREYILLYDRRIRSHKFNFGKNQKLGCS
jgi:hypothetical protein